MNILMVSPYVPSPTSGNRSRSYYLLKMLARQHTVSLLAIDDGVTPEAPQNLESLEDFTSTIEIVPFTTKYPKRVRQLINIFIGRSTYLSQHITEDVQSVLDNLLARAQYDAIVFECALASDYRLPPQVKLILDQHNIEYEVLYRTYLHETAPLRKWYNWRESLLVKQAEIRLCRRADALVMTSERELVAMKKILPDNFIAVVPNGVDIHYFNGDSAAEEREGSIIFTGSMEYYPNIEAVLFFARKCWPLIREAIPGATWQIVGKNPLPDVQKLAKLAGVTVTGSVADVRPYFTQAAVSIVPLLVGGGTRLKILEAMAMRKPVVSTSLGCEGLAVEPDKHLLIADKPEAFAQSVIELLKTSEKRRALGVAGRALVEAEYSWESCGDRLQRVVEEVTQVKTALPSFNV
jgi:sugar transferase (PEP-CTERM/EpsH1 system associated)